MLALTKKVDYGLIALCHLAQNRSRVATAREIAERYQVPHALLMNILKQLAAHALVRSSRGPRGGYELAVEPDAISLNDLIEIIEGPIRFVQCAMVNGDTAEPRCELTEVCPVSGPVRRLHQKLKSFLSETTLADIAFDPCFGRPPEYLEVGVAPAVKEH